jgi:hypothetical protein
MSSPSVTVSVNLKIKDQEITLSMEEASDLYSQLKGILGYNNQPYTAPYPWGNPSPYCTYTINCSDNTNSNWKTT